MLVQRIRYMPVNPRNPAAVDIGLRSVPDGSGRGRCSLDANRARTAVLRESLYRVPLAASLGNRVLSGQNLTFVPAVDPE